MIETGQWVVVTTEHRGVFFGRLEERHEIHQKLHVRLSEARNILFWSRDTRGFLGLASIGPAKGSRVGPKVDTLELRDVTSIAVASDAARDAFEEERWS